MANRLSRLLIGPSEAELRAAAPPPTAAPVPAAATAVQRFLWADLTARDIGVWSRDQAMTVPTVKRARNLLCSLVASLPLTLWRINQTDPANLVGEQLAPPSWMGRLDPRYTRAHTLAWLADDLIFHARAYLRITARYATGYPARFERMPAIEVNIDPQGQVRWRGDMIPVADVVEFAGTDDPVLNVGWRVISTALRLDAAAERFSAVDMPSGWLEQVQGEPMSADELVELATAWSEARQANATGALNQFVKFHEATTDPSRLQLMEARQHQAVELARLMDVPAYLVNAPAGTGMTYLNAQQAKSDLIDFGAMPLINVIEQTLGGPNVVPNGQYVRLDVNAWLRSPLTDGDAGPDDLQIAYDQEAT